MSARPSSVAPALTLVLFVALVGLGLWLAPDGEPDPRGVRSTREQGRRALLELLDSCGFDARHSVDRPGALAARGGLAWVSRLPAPLTEADSAPRKKPEPTPEPTSDPTLDPTSDPTPEPAPEQPSQPTDVEADHGHAAGDAPVREALQRGLSSPRYWRRFAEAGGAVLFEVGSTTELARIVDECGLPELASLSVRTLPRPSSRDSGPWAASWNESERLRLGTRPEAALVGLEAVRDGRALLETDAGELLIVEASCGRGRVIVSTAGVLFTNGKLAEADHAVVAVRLVEHAAPRGPVLLDEFGGFGEGAPSLLDFALRPRALAFTLALALLVAVLLWRAWRAREFPRDTPIDPLLSPRSRALARGRLLLRARRPDLIARDLRLGTALELAAAFGLSAELARAALASSVEARRFVELAAPGAPALRVEGWIATLCTAPVADDRELARLDRELQGLRAALLHAGLEESSPAPAPGPAPSSPRTDHRGAGSSFPRRRAPRRRTPRLPPLTSRP